MARIRKQTATSDRGAHLVEIRRSHGGERRCESCRSLNTDRWICGRRILLRNEFLATENEVLRSKLGARVGLTDFERIRLAKPSLGYRKLVAKKFDSSQRPRRPGRPRIDGKIEELVLKMVTENPTWGYDRIRGALMNAGHKISDQTVGHILERNGIPAGTAQKTKISWAKFIKMHKDVLSACDFFTAEVFTPTGLITYYDGGFGLSQGQRFLIHDRDTKFTAAFQTILKINGHWVDQAAALVSELECLRGKMDPKRKIRMPVETRALRDEGLRRAVREFVEHYRGERNHQGLDNVLLFPSADHASVTTAEPIESKERLGGLLKFYCRRAA